MVIGGRAGAYSSTVVPLLSRTGPPELPPDHPAYHDHVEPFLKSLNMALADAADSSVDPNTKFAPLPAPTPTPVEIFPHEWLQERALLDGNDPATATVGCTATMIGCETVLTAAHCVEPGHPSFVFLPHAGLFPVASLALNPAPGGLQVYRKDLAVLKLGAPITGIRPSALNTMGPVPDGTLGTIVGHGFTLANELGLKQVGKVTTSPCPDPPTASPAAAATD